MKKILLTIILLGLIIQPALAITQWTITIPTSTGESASNFPAENYANQTILQTLLQNYRQGYYLTYNNSTTLNISSGEVSVWNGSASLFLQNTSAQTATTANLDTGSSFASTTTYYVYCGSSSTTQATCTVTISLNNSAPSGVTYYKQLGNFTTDSSGNIVKIIDNLILYSSESCISETAGTPYLATTSGTLSADGVAASTGNMKIDLYSDQSSSPTTIIRSVQLGNSSGTNIISVTDHILRGYYYKTVFTNVTAQNPIRFCSTGQ